MRPFDLFFNFYHGLTDGPTGILSYRDVCNISAMFVGFPDEIHEEKPSFLEFENNWLRTDRRMDGPTNGPTDGQTLL